MIALESRIDRIESYNEIRNLAGRYCLAMDEHNLDEIRAIFASDAIVHSPDGRMNATGREAIVAMYEGRFSAVGPTNHFTHDHIVLPDAGDPDCATGRVNCHAEVWRNDQTMLVALRYDDVYRRTEGAWRFAERFIRFIYYVPATEYASVFASRQRIGAYGERRTADYPESVPTWRDHRKA